jgi:hypothetical protein
VQFLPEQGTATSCPFSVILKLVQSQQVNIGIIFTLLLVVILTLGGAVLGYQRLQQTDQKVAALQTAQSSIQAPVIASAGSENPSSPSATVASLQQQIEELSNRLAQVEKKVGVKNAPSSSAKSSGSTVKEYIVYIGSGQTANRDWTDITSAATTINTANYGQLKGVYFEAALSIVGGEAHARLKDQTTGQPIYQTEIFNNTSSPTWLTSSPMTLSSGTNNYIVQLRSTSGEMAILSGSRIHLFLK